MTLKTKIGIGVGVILLAGSGIVAGQITTAAVSPVVPDNPSLLSWTEPIDDAGWASDVKNESFDIKSTAALNSLVTALNQQLVVDQNTRIAQCSACIQYDLRQQLIGSGFTEPNLTTQVNQLYAEQFSSYNLDLQRIKRSIDRAYHELDLRTRGVVVRKDISP